MNEDDRKLVFEHIDRWRRREYARGYRDGRERAEAAAQVEFDLQIPTIVSIGIGMVCGVIASAVARLVWGHWQ